MKPWIAVFALAASVALPSAAGAQPQGDPGRPGPSPEMRATMAKLLAQARTTAFGALRADHRTQVQAIVAQAAARTLDPRAAAKTIDDVLAPSEKTAVLAAEAKLRAGMRAAMTPPPGGPPGGGPPGGMRDRTPDAGRFLMMVSRQERFYGPEPRSNGAQ